MVNSIDRKEGIERRVGERRARYFETGLAAFKRISWGAVFGGLAIALVVQLMLSLLGIGVGMGTVDPMEERDPLAGLGTGALIWGIVSMLIALFTGGLVAGRLAGIPRTIDSILHGLITFSLFTLVTSYLIAATTGTIISGAGGIAKQTLSLAAQGTGVATREAIERITKNGIDLSNIKKEAITLLEQTGKPELEPERLSERAKEGAEDIATGQQGIVRGGPDEIIDQLFGDATKEIDKEAVVNVIVARTDMSREEANRVADNWIQMYQDAKREFEELKAEAEQQARETGQAVATAVSRAGIFLFIGLIFGAIVAAVGGKLGEPHDVVSRKVTEDINRSEYKE